MNICKRTAAMLLVLVMILGLTGNIFAVSYPAKNTGARHTTCTQLSQQAEAYYTKDYTWDNLSALEGDSTGSSLNATNSELYKTLQKLMSDTQTGKVTYKSLTSYWPYTDTQPGNNDAVLFYSDTDGSGNNYNREHVWPKSRASFYQTNGGADLHHLRPTDSTINSTRGNMTMGNVRSTLTSYKTASYGGNTVLYYSSDADLVEINDNIKGDVARIFLYVYVRWGQPNLFENVSSSNLPSLDSDDKENNGLKVIESLSTLLQWCALDPVDEWEMCRNDRVQDVQGNRNVFIDYPELAWLLFDQELPADMDTPSGYAKSSGSTTSYNITAVSNNEAWGTVSVSGKVITAVPNAGYYVVNATVSPANAAKLTRNGDQFVLSGITGDVTVTVEFGIKEAAVISYAMPEGVTVSDPVTSAYVGDAITLPTVSGTPADTTQAYQFAGWVTSAVTDTADRAALTIYPAGGSFTVAATRVTLYPLYTYTKDGAGQSNTFTLLTAAPADWSGEYVMTGVVSASGDEYAHLSNGDNVGSTSGAILLSQAGITKNGNTLSNVTVDYVIEVAALPSGSYTMKLKGASSDCYLSYNGSGNSLSTAASASDAAAQWKFACSGSEVTITNVGTSDRKLQFNASSKMFRCYTGSQQAVQLYAAAGASESHYLTLEAGEAECQHKNTEIRGAKDAKCTEDGYTGDTYCTDCENKIADGNVIPATGHQHTEIRGAKNATCTEDGYTGDTYCTDCENKIADGKTIPANRDNCPSSRFVDLNEDWYHEWVDYVVENGLMTGMSSTKFGPRHDLKRAEVVTILYRIAGCPEVEGTTDFTDLIAGEYYVDAVTWATQNGIVKGIKSTIFAPTDKVTREQLVCFIARFARYLGGDTTTTGSLTDFKDASSVTPYAVADMTWAVENGIISGMGGSRLEPQGFANRAQAAKIIAVLDELLSN